MPADFELRSENHIIDSWSFQRLLHRSRAWLEANEYYREPYDILIAIDEQGRSPYEPDLIQNFDDQENQELGDQEYDGSGRPINLRSERIARDQVRAANEVLETAGIIEEYSTVKKREAKARKLKEEESRAGLRLLDYGRYSLQMGTWGIVSLRRRIMLFQPYSTMRFLEILRYERSHSSVFQIFFAGLPASIIQATISITENVLYRLGRIEFHNKQLLQDHESNVKLKYRIEKNIAYGIYALQGYVGLHVKLFTLLQQLGLVSSNQWFPSLKSLIPMSRTSPIRVPSLPSVMSIVTMQSWMNTTALSLAPIISVYLFDKISVKVTESLLLPLYNQMPKPISEDPNWIRKVEFLWHGYDSKAMHPVEPEERPASQHDQTLRILEGLPAEDENEDDEIVHATLVSFDVEASEMEATGNAYSAELRNMNAEPEPTAFRTNFLTTLPPIFSTEIFAKVIGGLTLVPFEMIMVRIVAGGFTRSAGTKMDVWEIPGSWRWARNIIVTQAIDLVVGGVIWIGISGISYFIRVGEIEEE